MVKDGYTSWLKTPGKKGQAHKDNIMRVFRDTENIYFERWDLLKLRKERSTMSNIKFAVAVFPCIAETLAQVGNSVLLTKLVPKQPAIANPETLLTRLESTTSFEQFTIIHL
jgi:hypothetical protein